MVRKATLVVGIPALLILIVVNAFLSVDHLRKMHQLTDVSFESSSILTDISNLRSDLTDMETGQRGYLLTENPSYLNPYNEAKARIGNDFARLHAALATHTERERSLASQLKSSAHSLQAELEHAITLRQQGYRHRAFMEVDSNQGMDLMNASRGSLDAIAASEQTNFAKANSERNASLSKGLTQTILANSILLVLTAGLFALARYHGRALEREAASSKHILAARSSQLQKLTSALSNEIRSDTSDIEGNARLLLENYGGFLPRHGHEYAEQIKKSADQMERLRQDLLVVSSDAPGEQAA